MVESRKNQSAEDISAELPKISLHVLLYAYPFFERCGFIHFFVNYALTLSLFHRFYPKLGILHNTGCVNEMVWMIIIVIVAFAAGYGIIFDKKIVITMPMAGFTIILIMYFISLLGMLIYYKFFVFALLVIVYVFAIKAVKSKKSAGILENIFSPGLMAFFMLAALLYYLSYDVHVFQWDEFSHWATIVKEMYYSTKLYSVIDSISWFKSYPPGMALWEFLFAADYAVWNDWTVIFAYNIFLLIMIMPMFSQVTWERAYLVPIGMIIVILLPYFYNTPWEGTAWRCVYIDRAISFNFAYILFAFWSRSDEKENINGKNEFFELFSLCAALCALTLLKSTGILFATLALIAFLAYSLIISSNKKKMIVRVILIGTVCILFSFVWNGFCSRYGIKEIWAVKGNFFSNVTTILAGKSEKWRYEIVSLFWDNFIHSGMQYEKGVFSITMLILPIIWTVLVITYPGNELLRKQKITIVILLSIEYVIYELSVLYTELFVLSESEGLILSGFARYSSNYSLGTIVFAFMILFYGITNADVLSIKSEIAYGVMALCLVTCVPIKSVFYDMTHHNNAVQNSYEITGFGRYIEIEDKYKGVLTDNDKIYIVTYEDTGGYFALRKELLPAKTCESYTHVNLDEDIIDNWKSILTEENCNYVFINKVSPEFANKYENVFEENTIEELCLYQIDNLEEFHLSKVIN